MVLKQATALLAPALLLVASCGGAPVQTASESMTIGPPATPSAVASSPDEVRLSLYTHCGVIDAKVNGVYWRAGPPQGKGSAPDGWGDPSTPGRWQQTNETTATFTADSGVSATFVKSEPPASLSNCA